MIEMVHTAYQPTQTEGEHAKKSAMLRIDTAAVFMLADSFLKSLKA